MSNLEFNMKFDEEQLKDEEDMKLKRSLYNVSKSGRGKRFINFEHLIKLRGLNGSIELNGVKITRWQIDGLRDYINSDETYRRIFREIDEYGATIVDSYENSDLSL